MRACAVHGWQGEATNVPGIGKANQCPACHRYNDRESCPYCGHTTDEQLAKLRQKAVAENAEYLGPNPVFTCDNCRQRNKCEFVFDTYNTNGDCLAEK